jgi:hypothetical protein
MSTFPSQNLSPIQSVAPRRRIRSGLINGRWTPEFYQLLGKSRKTLRKELRRIRSLWDAGHREKALRAERKLMRSFAMRVVATQRANLALIALAAKNAVSNDQPFPRRQGGYSGAHVRKIASGLDLWKTRDERVFIFQEPKESGGVRDICSFDLEHRAAQLIVKLVLENRPDALHPAQIARRPRGIEQGIAAVRRGAENGYKYVVAADMQNFYGSISTSSLAAILQLPARVIQTTVSFECLNVVRRTNPQNLDTNQTNPPEPVRDEIAVRPQQSARTHEAVEPEEDTSPHDAVRPENYTENEGSTYAIPNILGYTQRGIPQGSSCSPIVGDYVMKRLLHSLPSGVRVVYWVDDILILAKSRAKAQEALHALRTAMAVAPEGPFSFKYAKIRRLSDGVDFLGWNLKYRKQAWEARPSDASMRRVAFEVAEYSKQALIKGQVPEASISYLSSWRSHFRTWAGVISRTAGWQRNLSQWAEVGRLKGDDPQQLERMARNSHLLNPERSPRPRRRSFGRVYLSAGPSNV